MLEPMPDLAFMTTATTSGVTEQRNTIAQLSRRHVGDVTIQSGHLIACDPLGEFPESAFVEPIPVGTHPVMLCVAELPNRMHLVAYAILQLREQDPVTWEIAHVVRSPWPGMPDYFNVESGTACYLDAEAFPLLQARFDPTNPADPFRLGLAQELYEREPPAEVGSMSLELSSEPRMNAVLFETGWGNSTYRSYLGRDVTGVQCCVLTDFGVIDTDATATTAAEAEP